MSSLYTKVTLNSFSLTGPALAADGTTVDGWLASRFVGNPAGVAAPPSVAADLTQVTTASGLATLTGATLSTTYWLRVRLPTGQQGWFLFNTYGGASSGDPFTVVMPTPPAVAATPSAGPGKSFWKGSAGGITLPGNASASVAVPYVLASSAGSDITWDGATTFTLVPDGVYLIETRIAPTPGTHTPTSYSQSDGDGPDPSGQANIQASNNALGELGGLYVVNWTYAKIWRGANRILTFTYQGIVAAAGTDGSFSAYIQITRVV